MKTVMMKSTFLIVLLFVCSLLFISLPSFAGEGDSYVSVYQGKCPLEPAKSKNAIQLACKTYQQTTNYTCGTAAVMTLMHYYGKLSAGDMNQKTELRMALEMGANDEGVTMSQMSDWLSAHGFSVDSGSNVSSELIINNLKKGRPTIVAVNKHWILAKGFDEGSTPDKNIIQFSDSCCGVYEMTTGEIDDLWGEAHMPESHCSSIVGQYVVAVPK